MRQFDFLASTAIAKSIEAYRWIEIFMLGGLKNGDWNTGAAVHWFLSNKHPMVYSVTHFPDGRVSFQCEEGLVGRSLINIRVSQPA